MHVWKYYNNTAVVYIWDTHSRMYWVSLNAVSRDAAIIAFLRCHEVVTTVNSIIGVSLRRSHSLTRSYTAHDFAPMTALGVNRYISFGARLRHRRISTRSDVDGRFVSIGSIWFFRRLFRGQGTTSTPAP